MKVRERFTEILVSHGLSTEQAEAVMQNVIADEKNAPILSRWNDDIEGYQPQLLATIWYSVKQHALAYTDANIPRAFFRSEFE